MNIETLPHPPTRLTIDLPVGPPLSLLRPARPEAIIDALTELDADEKLPYWAELWPSSVGLACALVEDAPDVRGLDVTELGCGVALGSLAAARAGARRVLATDWYTECLDFARASARENGLSLETSRLDWRHPTADATADVVLAADVLYERRNAETVAQAFEALVRPGGRAVLADPGRTYLGHLIAAMSAWRCERRTRQVRSPHIPQGAAEIHLLTFTRG